MPGHLRPRMAFPAGIWGAPVAGAVGPETDTPPERTATVTVGRDAIGVVSCAQDRAAPRHQIPVRGGGKAIAFEASKAAPEPGRRTYSY